MFLCTGASGTGPAVGLPAFLWHDHICAVHVRALTVEVSVRTSMCLEMCAGVCGGERTHMCAVICTVSEFSENARVFWS